MRSHQEIILMLALLLVAGYTTAQEPSLGDVAREQRAKQASKTAKRSARIVTNEDIPERPAAESDAVPDSGQDQDQNSTDKNASSMPLAPSGHSAEEWKVQILAQKTLVAAQQQQVERFRASIRFVEANRYVNGAQYNEQQRRRQIQLGQMEKQLEQQKQRLADMQERARKAGFGNAVTDPNE